MNTDGCRSRRVALVTGASRGLGAGFATALAERGYDVVVTARTAGALSSLADELAGLNVHSEYAAADITSNQDMQALCRAIHDRWQHLDMLVHAAVHAPELSPVAHGNLGEFQAALEVNCLATVRLIEYVQPLLLASPSADAVFLADCRSGEKFFGAYGGSKACQVSLARSWRRELGNNSSIRVSILRPKPTATSLRRRFFPGENRSSLASPSAEARRLLDECLGMQGQD